MFNFFNGTGQRHTELYAVLGVQSDCSQADIKRAYRTLAMKHHPDKGGTADKFKAIVSAYETLYDPRRRKEYDAHGPAGSGGPDLGDLFKSMFTGASRVQISPITIRLSIDLADAYTGCQHTLNYRVKRPCEPCKGVGGTGKQQCTSCRGLGTTVKLRQLGPGLVQQIRSQCATCGGTGVSIASKCTTCNGTAFTRQLASVTVDVAKNVSNDAQIRLVGKGHHEQGARGDVIVVVSVKKHASFNRRGEDLHMTKTIGLVDALCGLTYDVRHVNGTTISVTLEGTTQTGRTQTVPGAGMTPTGTLQIVYTVRMPATFDAATHRPALVTMVPQES